MFEQLTLLNIFKETIGLPKESDSAALFDFTDEIVKSVLFRGTGVSGGKGRVVGAYKSGMLDVNFLKKEYGWGGWTQDYPDGSSGMADHDSKGITLVRWRDSEGVEIEPRQKRFIPWNSILPVIESMIENGEYVA